jgi:hypothetical protein
MGCRPTREELVPAPAPRDRPKGEKMVATWDKFGSPQPMVGLTWNRSRSTRRGCERRRLPYKAVSSLSVRLSGEPSGPAGRLARAPSASAETGGASGAGGPARSASARGPVARPCVRSGRARQHRAPLSLPYGCHDYRHAGRSRDRLRERGTALRIRGLHSAGERKGSRLNRRRGCARWLRHSRPPQP